MSDIWRYDGKRVVVTGSASGIGAATARLAAERGADVVGVDINEPGSHEGTFVQGDLSDPAGVDALVAKIGGPVDALFNCAGLSGGAAPAVPVMKVNFIGTRRLTEGLLEQMTSGASIASVASLGGLGFEENVDAVRDFLGQDGWDAAVTWCENHPEQFESGGYGFSKQSLIVWSMDRSYDLAHRGIRINTIGPGVTDTPMLDDSRKLYPAIDEMEKPLGRAATPEEQANILLFLNCDAASYLTGVNIWTDGGRTAAVWLGNIKE
jgi:NAD(P)-dependent dehydrogenase (short-subunit alcohol dehydrogenase family)